jgi:hypothetical protein
MKVKAIEELLKLPLPILLILIGLMMLDGRMKLVVDGDFESELDKKEFKKEFDA